MILPHLGKSEKGMVSTEYKRYPARIPKTYAIDGVARGAQEQSTTITKASQVATRISTAIDQVTNNVQAVTRDAAESAKYSRDGAKTVKDTIVGMEAIRSKVGLSASKVQ